MKIDPLRVYLTRYEYIVSFLHTSVAIF